MQFGPAIPCPKCCANAGQPCRKLNSKFLFPKDKLEPHAERLAAYRHSTRLGYCTGCAEGKADSTHQWGTVEHPEVA